MRRERAEALRLRRIGGSHLMSLVSVPTDQTPAPEDASLAPGIKADVQPGAFFSNTLHRLPPAECWVVTVAADW